ncbi:MAG TPA: ABC transporter permease [Candidatus Atribacteria bacterium]|nr:ABC transporter permease [Candidatus Atribacteria bacterium]HPT79304.1 ABC transporter permease [Candidatus Atribacteria bacterium]
MTRLLHSFKDFFKVIFRNRQATIGLFILTFFVLLATVGAALTPLDMTVDYANRFQMPSWKHPLGTDYVGRDILAQVIHGSRDVITLGVVCAVMALGIGVIIGSVSAFVGGFTDTLLSFFTNIFLTIPAFPLMLILAVAFNVQNIWAAGFILAIVSWGGVARVVRGQILSLKHAEYIIACRIMGLKYWYIIFKEILPNMVSLLAVQFIGLFQNGIASSMGLMMLGVLTYRPTNWGVMLSLALQNTGIAYNPKGLIYFVTPIVCLALLQLGCIFFSSGIDQALNPRLRTE